MEFQIATRQTFRIFCTVRNFIANSSSCKSEILLNIKEKKTSSPGEALMIMVIFLIVGEID